MTILSDTDALTLTNALPTLDKPQQDQAKPLLQAYVAAKREQGLAPFEPSAEEKRLTRDRQRANFAGLDKLDVALGADKAKALDDATVGAENPRGMKARAIVEQHISETIGNLPAGWNEQGWDATKSVYADHVLGIKRDNIQDEELYQLIGQRFQKEDDEQAMWGERAASLADSAVKGESYADAWKNMTVGIGTDQRWDEKTHDLRRNQFRDFYGKLQSKTTELTPLAEHAVEVLKTYGGTTNLRRAIWSTDSLKNLTSEIANLPREDWPVLASLIQAKNKPMQEMAGGAGIIEKGLAKLGVRTARDFLDLAKDAINVDQTQVENNARIAKLPYEEAKKAYQAQAIVTRRQQTTEFTPADYEAFKAKSEADTKRIDAADFVNGLANGVINPQKFDNYIVDALASSPGMVAYTAMSAVPYVGIPLILNTTYNKEMRDARSRGVAWGDTSTFSMGSAAVQTALEHFIGQKLLFGTLPVLQRIAAKPLTAATAKAFAGRAAFQFATTYVPEFATEASQDIMGMVFQTIASRLDPSIPAATMEDLKSYGATLPATAIALLPMTLIGTANATFADKAFGRQYLSSERSLMAVGFTREAAAEILAAPTQEAAYEMVHGFWDNEEKRQMDTEEQRQAMAALESEMAGYSASQSQGANIAQTDAGTYAVYNSVGQYVDEAATVEDALALKEDVDKAEAATNQERVRDLIDFFEARLGGATIYDPNTIQRLSDRIGKPEEQGGMTEQQANALVDLYIKMGAIKPGNTAKTVTIPGESIRVYDAKTKIYSYAERLWAGANPLTLVEEKTETHIKEQIDRGSVTVNDIEGWQDQVEGKQDRAGMNDEMRYRAAVEFFSKSAKAYVLGRGEQEKALPLTMRAVMEQLREFFANLMELTARLIQMEQDGNLPIGFRGELRRALKLDDAYVNKIQAAQEMQANMEADFGKYGDLMSILRSRKLPAPSIVKEDPLHGDWKQLYDNMKPKDRLKLFVTFKRDAAGQKQKVAGQLDRVRESLTEEGFDFPMVSDMITAIEDAYRMEAAGKKVWPTMTGVGRVAAGGQYGATFSLQTDTPKFRAWFGDSKVVDADGKPLVVYHGTDAQFNIFKLSKEGAETGIFLTSKKEMAGLYGKQLMPVYVSLKNPKVFYANGQTKGEFGVESAMEQARIDGHDGVIINDLADLPGEMEDELSKEEIRKYTGDLVIAFDPSQIKSATNNRGTFDAANPDITYSLADEEMAPRLKRPFSPVVRNLLQRRAAGEPISREAIDTAIRETFPSRQIPVPQPGTLPTREQIDAAINSAQRESRIDVATIKPGTPLTLRQDVPSWERHGVGVVTVQLADGKGYEASAAITNPMFVLNEKKTLEIGLGGAKGPHIAIRGNWDADQSMPTDLENWTQVGFNPDRHSFYYERGTERQVIGGDKAFQIGNTVFVKNAVFGTGNISDITYSLSDEDYTNRLEETIKQRRVAMRVEQDPQYADEVRKAAAAMTYTVRSRSVGDDEAQVIIAKHGGDVAKLREVIMDRTNKVHMDTKTAIAQILMQAANKRGDYAAVSDILSIWAPVATEAGQFIEGLKRFVVLDTEEGAQAFFRREIDRNNRNAPELSEKEKAAIPQIAAELFQVFQDMQDQMGNGQLAWLTMDGPLPVSRADALRKFVDAAKQTLWERYKASVANAIEAKVTPKDGGAGKALLQIFSSDIQAEILAALPEAERGATEQATAQELANRASDILSQPERYKGIIAEARKRIEASTALTEEQKDAALAALKTKELGGSPVTVILNKLIKQAFDEANTTPRKVAAEGTVKAMEVEGLITSKIASLFSQDFAKSIAQEVSGIVQNMLADARAEVATVITRKEIQRQFLAEEELQKAKQLLESGTDEEIVAYLDSRRLPDENVRLKALREETAKVREELRAKTITAEQLEIALIGRMKAKDIATTRDLRQTIGRALKMFNAGKLSVKGLEQIFRNKYKLPTPSPQQNAELAKLARNIASTPIGSNERVYQTLQLFAYMHEQIRPYDWVDVGVGLWYSGVLASIITNARNVLGNAAFMAFDVGEMAATKLFTEPSKALDYYAQISNGAVEGLKIGLGLAETQVKEGRRSPIQQQDAAVERGGGAMESKSKIAGPRAIARPMEESRAISKYIGRIMSATDATFQASSYELAARHLAIKMVQDRVDAGEITQDMAPYEVERMLNLTAEQQTNHAAQAKTEWDALTENIQRQTDEETWIKNRANELRQMDRNGQLVELATRMARRATFQYQPEGVIGVVALSVDAAFGRAMRFAESLPATGAKAKALKAATAWLRVNSVPFIRTPANVFNRGLDYGPVGLVRAMFDAADVPVMVPGGEDYKRSDEEKQRVLMRGIYGTVAMGALLLACVPPAPEDDEKNVPLLQIHGRGSGNRDKDLAQNGRKWKPYSLEVKLPGGGKVFIDYRLMPVAPYLAAIGFVHDRRRYGKDRNQEAVYEAYVFGQGMFTAALGQSPMTSLQELVLSTDENRPTSERAISNVVARATAGQAANLVPMAGFFRSLETLAGGEKKSRADIKSAMLAQLPFGSQFNDPTVDALGEPIKGRFGIGWLADWEKDDSPSARIYKTWADRDVMPSDLNGYRKEMGGQFYEFAVERGQNLKAILLANDEERLKRLASLSDQLDDEDRSQARAYMSSLSRAATAQALYKFRQQQPTQAE
jgi:hypothetical protein